MSLKALERLPGMSAQDLDELERNAHRLANQDGPQSADAQVVLAALVEERASRHAVAQTASAAALEAIARRMSGLPYAERIKVAFAENPPTSWERNALRALAEHEGQTTEQLSIALGFSGTYMNLAFGTMCSNRIPWLGPAPANEAGEIFASALLVDFVSRKDEVANRRWTEWWYRPAARGALDEIRLI